MYTHSDFIFVIVCYLFGSIPFGLLLSKFLKKEDPRLAGSKNIGATNILRISGIRLGFLTLFFDVLKAFLPIKFLSSIDLINIEMAIVSVIIGHLFPIWIKFKGGKGIAVLIGSMLAYDTNLGLFFIFIWILTAFLTRYSSLAALVSCFSTFLLMYFENDNLLTTMFCILILVVYKHLSNIKRLFSGEESKIILKKVK